MDSLGALSYAFQQVIAIAVFYAYSKQRLDIIVVNFMILILISYQRIY